MAVDLTVETVGSQEQNVSLENPSMDLMFVVGGSFDEAEIRAAIEAQIPATWPMTSSFFGTITLVLQSYSARQRDTGGAIYDGVAKYGRRQPRKTGQLWMSFDGTGATAHIQTSINTVDTYGRPDIAGAPTGVASIAGGGGALAIDTYYYVVTAVGLSGESTASTETSTVINTGGVQTVNLTWNAVANATSYKVYRSLTSGNYASPSLIATVTSGEAYADAGASVGAGTPPTSFTPTASTPPDTNNAIGVSSTSVEGCDKVVPIGKFRLDWYPPVASMTAAYWKKLHDLSGKTNDGEWRGFAAGEILFLGPTGQPRGYDDWEVGLHFIASPNKTGIVVGTITGIAKSGHDYLWFMYRDKVDDGAKMQIKEPVFGFVEQVYETGNFSDLGIDGVPIEAMS